MPIIVVAVVIHIYLPPLLLILFLPLKLSHLPSVSNILLLTYCCEGLAMLLLTRKLQTDEIVLLLTCFNTDNFFLLFGNDDSS